MNKILVVDDEPSLRMLVSASLEDEGYSLSEAADGIEAYNVMQRERPDLVIMDVMMPGLTGYELCTRVKENPSLRDTLVLMLTAKGQEMDRVKSRVAGADYYLRKPFSPFELIEVVQSLLKGKDDGGRLGEI